jgi:hypothetical protein
LKDWDSSKKVTNIAINKDWANNQVDSKEDILDKKRMNAEKFRNFKK